MSVLKILSTGAVPSEAFIVKAKFKIQSATTPTFACRIAATGRLSNSKVFHDSR